MSFDAFESIIRQNRQAQRSTNYLESLEVTGTTVYNQMQLASGVSATDTTITVLYKVDTIAADLCWVVIDPFTVECEIRKVTGVSGSDLTVAALGYDHDANDPVLMIVQPVANVKWFGAEGDGSTDDETALERAWANLSANWTMYLPEGTYAIGDTILWSDKQNINIYAYGAILQAKSGTNFSNKILLDFGGSRFCKIYGLKVYSTLSSNYPAALLALHNTAAGDGINNTFYDCWFEGITSVGCVYNICAEIIIFQNCYISASDGGTGSAYFDSSSDDASLLSDFGGYTSNTRKHFYYCNINQYTSTYPIFTTEGVTWELTLRDCYLYMAGGGANAFNFVETDDNDPSIYGFIVSDVRIEVGTANADNRFVFLADQGVGTYWRMENSHIFSNLDYVIELEDLTSGSSGLYGCLINIDCTSYTQKLLYIGESRVCVYCDINCYVTGGIVTGTSASLEYSRIYGGNNVSGPFSGNRLWDNESYNHNLTYWRTELNVGARTRKYKTLSQNDATPTISGAEYFIENYSVATDITDFDDHVDGQIIHIIFTSSNSNYSYATIKNNANILLFGNTDWTPYTGSTLTLIYGHQGSKWYEISRNDYDLKKLRCTVLTAEPADKANGMIVYADGSTWDPGSGAGIYAYEGSSWVKL